MKSEQDQIRDQLIGVSSELADLHQKVKDLEAKRDALIPNARDVNISVQEVADLLGLSKGRISQIVKSRTL